MGRFRRSGGSEGDRDMWSPGVPEKLPLLQKWHFGIDLNPRLREQTIVIRQDGKEILTPRVDIILALLCVRSQHGDSTPRVVVLGVAHDPITFGHQHDLAPWYVVLSDGFAHDPFRLAI